MTCAGWDIWRKTGHQFHVKHWAGSKLNGIVLVDLQPNRFWPTVRHGNQTSGGIGGLAKCCYNPVESSLFAADTGFISFCRNS
ncbi:unnamed protein product [Protopolystoma xenopodis]|uniref:Uncharacterized protein n=1 Tax=Protopolystoma xenopodis TaxID=117903 RepID=A0A3S4ZRX9_9PLAT|nr:unnamed protein product [Protopolystoma xenopodis]